MYIECPDLSENKKIAFQTAIKGSVFTFLFSWNDFCDCCFLDIFDNNGSRLYCGNALVLNSKIFTKKKELPDLYFFHKDMKPYEATPETMKDYIIYYEDTAE